MFTTGNSGKEQSLSLLLEDNTMMVEMGLQPDQPDSYDHGTALEILTLDTRSVVE